MKLLVISHTPHYLKGGRLVAWGPTVRELDYLAEAFGSVSHLAPLHQGPGPESAIAYTSSHVEFLPLRSSGGDGAARKLGVLMAVPGYFLAIMKAAREADIIQVRCPCNIGLVACVAMALDRRLPRWAKYAGNWKPAGAEPLSYRLQRWWLRRRLHGGPVTVNGEWPGQPDHVYSFLNPCLSEAERLNAAATTDGKAFGEPVQLLFVGRTEAAKGTGRAIEILARLIEAGYQAALDVVGGGPEKAWFQSLAVDQGVMDHVVFHGWMSRSQLEGLYRKAHLLVLPSTASEGWPKVLSEAMAFRAVPLAGAVSSIGQVLQKTGAGLALPPEDVRAFVTAVEGFLAEPRQWSGYARAGVEAAQLFTYENYVAHLEEVLDVRLKKSQGVGFAWREASPSPSSEGGRG